MSEVKPKKQPLSLSQMHQGFMTALTQAERLADESRVLARKKRFAGALSKAILGLEEVGKNRLLLYRAATVVMGTPAAWKLFWSAYRSHKEKLALAMTWGSILSPQLLSAEDVAAHLKYISEEAERLDRRKQQSQYGAFDGKEFTSANDKEFRDEANFIRLVLQTLCTRLRIDHPENLAEDEFLEFVSEKIRLSRALGFIDTAGKGSAGGWAASVAEGNTPVLGPDGVLPSIEAFQRRVENRYRIIPPRIPVTLRRLNSSQEFETFYDAIRARYGYPDWVIISTIYNIAFNARVISQAQKPPSPDEVAGWMEWAEKPDDKPLAVGLFTDEVSFNLALDLWLTAFLAALGVAIPDLRADNTGKIRRAASRHYPVFEYDLEHWPIFDFGADTEEPSKP